MRLELGLAVIALGMSSCGSNNRSNVPNNPVPSVVSVSPATTTVGQAFVLLVNGSGFIAQSSILWNGTARPTTFVTSNQLTANIPATDVASTGAVQIQVSNPSPGGGTSNTVNLNVDNPQPSLISFSPFSAQSGGGSFQLTVYGSNFVPNAVVLWNGRLRSTAFVSSSQLSAEISASDIASAGIARISVLNPSPGGGASRIFRFDIGAAVAIQRFLYAANSNANTISGYNIDPNSGVLTELPGSPFVAGPTGTSAGWMIGDRFGQFLYVANNSTIGCKSCDSLSVFSQNGQGNLVPVPGSPFPGMNGLGVADPTGNIVYQTVGNDIVTSLIDASRGALIQLADSPGFAPFVSMAMHPAGTFLYGASGNGVWVGSTSFTSGALTVLQGSPFGGMSVGIQAPVGAPAIAVDPSGKFAFAVNNTFQSNGSSALLRFTIDAATGALTLLNSTPFASPVDLSSVLVHPSGGFLYATGQGNNSIQAFTIDASGTLTPVTGSPFSAGLNPIGMAMDPEGKFLYVANYAGSVGPGNISAFTVNINSGALTPIAGSPFPAGNVPVSMVISPP